MNRRDNILTLYESGDVEGTAINIVEESRAYAGQVINFALVVRNWLLGRLIVQEELKGKDRAEYGAQVIKKLSARLTDEFGKGFGYRDLYRCKSVYNAFPEILTTSLSKSEDGREILTTALSKSEPMLSWSHYWRLSMVDDVKAREWYKKEAIEQTWSFKTLDRNISTQYYQRMLATQSEQMAIETQPFEENRKAQTLEFIKNPVVAEFLGLEANSDFSESTLENSIITHLQKFLLEMGKGYAFVARQQHIKTDAGDFYIDLVFYNIYLKCYLLIDLKIGQITHQDVGQMDMYVRMYDDMKLSDGDNPTIGLLLCSETSEDIARYSVLHDSDRLFAAKYLTYLPTKEELAREIERQKEVFRLQEMEKVSGGTGQQ